MPPQLAAVMGWNDSLWARQAPPEYPCLIDAGHVVAELYGMYNVPQAVWIDEQGRIVRPNTKPGLGITINEKAVKKHPFQQEIVLREFNRDGAVTDW